MHYKLQKSIWSFLSKLDIMNAMFFYRSCFYNIKAYALRIILTISDFSVYFQCLCFGIEKDSRWCSFIVCENFHAKPVKNCLLSIPSKKSLTKFYSYLSQDMLIFAYDSVQTATWFVLPRLIIG